MALPAAMSDAVGDHSRSIFFVLIGVLRILILNVMMGFGVGEVYGLAETPWQVGSPRGAGQIVWWAWAARCGRQLRIFKAFNVVDEGNGLRKRKPFKIYVHGSEFRVIATVNRCEGVMLMLEGGAARRASVVAKVNGWRIGPGF